MRYIRIEKPGGSGSRPANPLVQALAFVVGIIVFISAVFIGGIVIAALVGFFLVAGLIMYARVWWLMRKAASRGGAGDFVEAEYRVIDTTAKDDTER